MRRKATAFERYTAEQLTGQTVFINDIRKYLSWRQGAGVVCLLCQVRVFKQMKDPRPTHISKWGSWSRHYQREIETHFLGKQHEVNRILTNLAG